MSEHGSSCADAHSFSNDNPLDWNQKKQDMILNLGLASSNQTDQTPTPTRFIRNCEEVGLFQDLQNVNPFDEVFKMAIDNPTSVSLQVPSSTSDDTLHTPQIYPPLEETSNSHKATSFSNIDHSIDQDLDNSDNPLVIVLDPDNEVVTTSASVTSGFTVSNASMALLSRSTTVRTARNKTNKRKSDKAKIRNENHLLERQESNGLTTVPLDKLLRADILEVIKQREANKAAQSRCRKRKQQEIEDIRLENQRLKNENENLSHLNAYLKGRVASLEQQLLTGNRSVTENVMATNQTSIVERISAVSIHKRMEQTTETVTSTTSTNLINPASSCNASNVTPSQNSVNVMQIPLSNMPINSNNITLIFPQTPQTIILPQKQLENGNNKKAIMRSSVKKIMPKYF